LADLLPGIRSGTQPAARLRRKETDGELGQNVQVIGKEDGNGKKPLWTAAASVPSMGLSL
jgi:hypothetical protein